MVWCGRSLINNPGTSTVPVNGIHLPLPASGTRHPDGAPKGDDRHQTHRHRRTDILGEFGSSNDSLRVRAQRSQVIRILKDRPINLAKISIDFLRP